MFQTKCALCSHPMQDCAGPRLLTGFAILPSPSSGFLALVTLDGDAQQQGERDVDGGDLDARAGEAGASRFCSSSAKRWSHCFCFSALSCASTEQSLPESVPKTDVTRGEAPRIPGTLVVRFEGVVTKGGARPGATACWPDKYAVSCELGLRAHVSCAPSNHWLARQSPWRLQ